MRLALGSVQFGLDYGISNTGGRTPHEEISRILDAARAARIELIDTAAAYGESEQVLASLDARGRGFRMVSKTARLANGLQAVIARAKQSVLQLGRPLDALLVHSAQDLLMPEGAALWKALERLRADGEIKRIGISFYASDPILAMAKRFKPQVAQVAASFVDQRLARAGVLRALADLDVEIHVRSAFHQGLIFIPPEKLPQKLRGARAEVEALQDAIAKTRLAPARLALSYLDELPEIAYVVVGVTKAIELAELAAAARELVTGVDFARLAINDELLLDPTRW